MVIPRVLHQKSAFPSQHLVRIARDGGIILPQKMYLCDNIALRLVRKNRAEYKKLPLPLVHYCFHDYSALSVFREKVQHSAIASLLGFGCNDSWSCIHEYVAHPRKHSSLL